MEARLLRHRHLLLLGDDVVADRVVDPRALPRVEPLVVRGVVPREHGRVHRVRVERPDVVDDGLGLLRVDRDRLAVGGDVLGAVAPEDRVERADGVRRLADGEADRMAELLQLAPSAEQIVPGVGRLLPDLLEEVDAMAARERGEEEGEAEPLALDERVLPQKGIPVAVFLREVVRDVGDVGEARLEEPRVVHLEAHDVVPRARHELRRELGGHLDALYVVDAHADAGELREALGQLLELHVRGGRVVHGRQEADLARRPRRGRAASREDARETGGAVNECTPADARLVREMFRGARHDVPPGDGERDRPAL